MRNILRIILLFSSIAYIFTMSARQEKKGYSSQSLCDVEIYFFNQLPGTVAGEILTIFHNDGIFTRVNNNQFTSASVTTGSMAKDGEALLFTPQLVWFSYSKNKALVEIPKEDKNILTMPFTGVPTDDGDLEILADHRWFGLTYPAWTIPLYGQPGFEPELMLDTVVDTTLFRRAKLLSIDIPSKQSCSPSLLSNLQQVELFAQHSRDGKLSGEILTTYSFDSIFTLATNNPRHQSVLVMGRYSQVADSLNFTPMLIRQSYGKDSILTYTPQEYHDILSIPFRGVRIKSGDLEIQKGHWRSNYILKYVPIAKYSEQ